MSPDPKGGRHNKSMGAIDPWDVASLDPKGLIGSIYVGDHKTLLHTRYISCGPHGFREDFLNFFSILKVYVSHMLPWQPNIQSNQPKNLMQSLPHA